MGLFNKIIEGIKGLFGIKSKNQPKQLDAPRTRNSVSIGEFKQQEESYNNEKQENDLNSVYEDFKENIDNSDLEDWEKEVEDELGIFRAKENGEKKKEDIVEDKNEALDRELSENLDKGLSELDNDIEKEKRIEPLIRASFEREVKAMDEEQQKAQEIARKNENSEKNNEESIDSKTWEDFLEELKKIDEVSEEELNNDSNSIYEDFVENNSNQTESEEWKKELEEDLGKLKYEEDRVVHSEQELVEDMDKQLEGLDEKNKKEQNRKLLIQAYARGKLEEQLEESKRAREDEEANEKSEKWKESIGTASKRLKVRTDEEERLSEEQLDEFLKNIRKMDDEAVLESKAKKIEEEKYKEELEKELAKQKKEHNNVETEVWKYKLGKDLREMDDDSVKEKENPFER